MTTVMISFVSYYFGRPSRSTVFAAFALLLLLSLLTSCSTKPQTLDANLRLYAADVIRLPKGVPVQTLDGVYIPQEDEFRHSDYRYRKLERMLLSPPGK